MSMNPFSGHEIKLLNDWQRDFPLTSRPYEIIASNAELTHQSTISSYQRLADKGVVSRIGAVVNNGVLGSSTLACMSVAKPDLEDIAGKVSAHRGVNHNYERTHHYNLWFVITAPDQGGVNKTITDIEAQTGLSVMSLPMLEAYHIDLGFNLNGNTLPRPTRPAQKKTPIVLTETVTCPVDRELLWVLEDGLGYCDQPYDDIARALDLSVDDVLNRIDRLQQCGAIRRFGVVVRHHELGYKANAMVVWNIPDGDIFDAVPVMTAAPYVTLCYRRPRRLPGWKYNIFSMIHGLDHDQVMAQIDELARQPALSGIEHEILFSKRRFKQTGARYSPAREVA